VIAHARIERIQLGKNQFEFDIKRLDLLHSEYGGNKWFKLKYNIEAARRSGHDTLLSFGGSHSNHLYALAHAGRDMGFRTIGVIRGENQRSAAIDAMRNCGMIVAEVSRLAYAEKETDEFKEWLHNEYGDFYMIPEGGSNFLGVNGCMEILSESERASYDVIVCASGTGATAAGLLLGCPQQRVWSVPVLRPENEMRNQIHKHLRYFLGEESAVSECMSRLEIVAGYTHGGYARASEELLSFINSFEHVYNIPLDAVYTGKLMNAVCDMIDKGKVNPPLRIVVIHSGGLQGRRCGDILSFRS
jgi:1-aminocyclopropane-1-carboxylate deaminase